MIPSLPRIHTPPLVMHCVCAIAACLSLATPSAHAEPNETLEPIIPRTLSEDDDDTPHDLDALNVPLPDPSKLLEQLDGGDDEDHGDIPIQADPPSAEPTIETDSIVDDAAASSSALPAPADLFEESEQADEEEISEDRASMNQAPAQPAAPSVDEHEDAERLSLGERGQRALERFSKPAISAISDWMEVLRTQAPQDADPLTPYLEDTRWTKAMRALEEGQCESALADARAAVTKVYDQSEPPEAVRYAVAMIQRCGKERAEGDETLRAIARGESGTADLARAVLGLTRRARSDEASTPGLRGLLDAQSARARRGDLDGALRTLEVMRDEARSGNSWYRIRLTEARLLESAKRMEDASQVWRAIYLRTRDWRSGESIENMVEDFEKRSKISVLSLGDRVDRMRELIARGRSRDARRVSQDNARRAGVRGGEIKGWGLYRQALEAERSKEREKADKLFGQADKLIAHPAIRPRLYVGWARALRRLNRDREAVALYDRVCDEAPGTSLCADSLYEAGRLLQYAEDFDASRARFASLVGLYPDHDRVSEAVWLAAFGAVVQQKWDTARSLMGHVLAHWPDDHDASDLSVGLKAQYWLGVIEMKSGQRLRAIEAFHDTIARGPLTWYGRLAASRLESMGERERWRLPSSGVLASRLQHLGGAYIPREPRLQGAVELARLGWWAAAEQEVIAQSRGGRATPGSERLLAHLRLMRGRPDLAHWAMRRHVPEHGPVASTLRDWGTAYPLDYMEYTHQWAITYGVDPFLAQAIIRQESGFRPAVRSHAGAMGLMQLMPGTARYTAKLFASGEEIPAGSRDLVDPAKNIRLGVMYIRLHTAHAADHAALALAGYNAGPAPLKRWLRQYGDRELDAWVESITYREARGYVRKVMTSYITYAGLYGSGELPRIELSLPSQLRPWGKVPERGFVDAGDEVSWRVPEGM